ncbi:hypothetical protein JCM3765_007897 [Sporobolomyces pararoseus]
MEERRVLKPPLSSRSASGQGSNSKSSRLPKPSSSSSTRPIISRPISQTRPQISSSSRASSSSIGVKQSFVPSTSLPYLNHSSGTTSQSTLPTSSSRRNLSITNLQAHSRSSQILDPQRPHSFPPPVTHQERPSTNTSILPTTTTTAVARLPPRVTQDPSNASLDPFKVHANRILRPSASARTSVASITSLPAALPPRSSSLTCPSTITNEKPRRSAQPPLSPCSLLRRTTTVRSASSSYSISSRRSRGVGHGHGRRKPSISGTESFIMKMSRTNSSQGGGGGGGRGGRVLLEQEREFEVMDVGEEGADENLVGHWKAFVGVGEPKMISSPLIDQLPPPTSPFTSTETFSAPEPGGEGSNTLPRMSPTPISPRDSSSSKPPPSSSHPRHSHHSRSRSSKILSIASIPRELSQTLPQLNHYLHTRAPSHPPPSTLDTIAGTEMTRVDSEVLLTRLTLKRLGSRGFEGDALDKLGRSEGGIGSVEEEGVEQEVEDWADRYRDSYSGSWDEDDSVQTISPSSSSSSASSIERMGKIWKSSLPSSCSTSTVSSSTSIGTLSMSRNWSKSSLMDELEKEVGRLSRDFDTEQPSYTEVEEEEYVCALDLIWEDSEASSSEAEEGEGEENVKLSSREIPVRRGGGPLLAAPPLGAPITTSSFSSRLPRLKPSNGNLKAAAPPLPPPVPTLPRGFVSKLARPVSVANKYTAVGIGRGTASLRARAGWV